ncbi:MAG TPA: hypothetical protein DEO86_20490 [Colwellia sp.]|nr:hypothetical protein [Colwellia sp.]|tara:strand:- start:38 stop:640 length:603 start_codon:yes stop_codon:yes gene_type:complete
MKIVKNITNKLFKPKTRLDKVANILNSIKNLDLNVLDTDELSKFEQSFGITLPEDYRNYINKISNGGDGLLYGFLTLEESIEVTRRFGKGLPDDIFSTEFPHVSSYNPAEDSYWEELSDQVSRKEISYEDYISEYRYVNAGTLPIFSGGCGTFVRLVITGPSRGQIWGDDEHNDNGYVPVEKDFITWIEKFLQRRGLKNS